MRNMKILPIFVPYKITSSISKKIFRCILQSICNLFSYQSSQIAKKPPIVYTMSQLLSTWKNIYTPGGPRGRHRVIPIPLHKM
jgi:hypothetical protein